jgi:hypothetical protein
MAGEEGKLILELIKSGIFITNIKKECSYLKEKRSITKHYHLCSLRK